LADVGLLSVRDVGAGTLSGRGTTDGAVLVAGRGDEGAGGAAGGVDGGAAGGEEGAAVPPTFTTAVGGWRPRLEASKATVRLETLPSGPTLGTSGGALGAVGRVLGVEGAGGRTDAAVGSST
jgi:hypothetical protein